MEAITSSAIAAPKHPRRRTVQTDLPIGARPPLWASLPISLGILSKTTLHEQSNRRAMPKIARREQSRQRAVHQTLGEPFYRSTILSLAQVPLPGAVEWGARLTMRQVRVKSKPARSRQLAGMLGRGTGPRRF